MLPRDVRVRIPGCPTNKLWARTTRTRVGQARKVNRHNGQGRSRAGWTRKGKDMLRAGRTRTVMGRMDKGLDGLDVKKLDANSSGLSPRLDARIKMAEHSLKQSYLDTLDYKQHSLGKLNF